MKNSQNSKRLDRKNDNKKFTRFFIGYTVIFAVALLAVIGYFLISHKTFITQGDGWKQHFKAFVYLGQYCREVIRTLLTEHSLVLPQWNFSIGYGGDIITTLHYYCIGDPLDLISVVTPTKYSIYIYTLLMMFRFYLSGLFFAVYSFYRDKNRSINAVIAGALIYSFTTYSLFFAFVHPFFMNPVVYLPLLLVGVEKIFNKERPYLLVIMVFISAISNFYFFYMLVFVTVVYVFFRLFFIYKKGEFKQAFGSVFKIGVSSVIGLLMSCAILAPVIMAFITDNRTGADIEVNLFYPAAYYKNFLSSFITSSTKMGSMTGLGLSSVSLLSVFLLFIKKKENKELKILFILSTIALMLPVTGYLLNGFSYIANRWIWAYVMIIAYIVVVMWDEITSLNHKDIIRMFALLAVYGVAAFVCIQEFDKNLIISIAIAVIAMIIIIIASKVKMKKFADTAILLLIIVSLSANSYFNCHDGNVNKDGYFGYRSITNKLTDNAGTKMLDAVDDDSFYRYSGSNLTINSDLVNGTKSTSFYWSLQNSAIAQFMEEMDMPYRYLYSYANLDNRASLNALASVKYYTSNAFYNKPYGFGKIADGVYQNVNALPIGYTYSGYITRDEYDNLPALQKQQALMQAVLLEEESNHYSKIQPVFTEQNIEYELVTDQNISYENGKLEVKKSNASITLNFDGLENSETYVYMEYNGYEATKRKSGTIDLTVNSETEKGKCAENEYTFNTQYSIRHDDRNQWLFNAGYSKDAKKSITVTFSTVGTYDIPVISVICQPMDNFNSQELALKENVLENVSVKGDVIQGNISLEDDKILCLSVPYSTGWTAYVDGQEVDLLQANTMYMALELTAGDHDIKLVYTTPYLKAGICLSRVGIMAFAGYIVITEIQKKKKTSV